MKNYILIFFLLISIFSFGQSEGQDFCDGDKDASYFPLNIRKKKIFWYNTYYFEEKLSTKDINEKKYTEYKQTWKDGSVDLLYLRENNNMIFQFEEGLKNETIRFNPQFKIDYSWKKLDKTAIYTIKSYEGKLNTPYCKYENLLIIEAEYKTVTYNFYYLKGLGYVGATKNDKLISYITPEI